jgi:hypothetical protein
MTLTARSVLLLVAVVLFLLAGLGIGVPRVNLTALGLAAFAGAFLAGG